MALLIAKWLNLGIFEVMSATSLIKHESLIKTRSSGHFRIKMAKTRKLTKANQIESEVIKEGPRRRGAQKLPKQTAEERNRKHLIAKRKRL